jgi:hypothetical protein
MWIRDKDGNLVNMDMMSYVGVYRSHHGWAVIAYGQLTSSEDHQHNYYIFEGTEDECKAVVVSLPMPIAWDARKALS